MKLDTKSIYDVLKKHNVKKASIFGSYAKDKYDKKSDVDILVEFKGKATLLDLVRLKKELEKKLGKSVDVLTYKSVHPLLKDEINKTKVDVYEGG